MGTHVVAMPLTLWPLTCLVGCLVYLVVAPVPDAPEGQLDVSEPKEKTVGGKKPTPTGKKTIPLGPLDMPGPRPYHRFSPVAPGQARWLSTVDTYSTEQADELYFFGGLTNGLNEHNYHLYNDLWEMHSYWYKSAAPPSSEDQEKSSKEAADMMNGDKKAEEKDDALDPCKVKKGDKPKCNLERYWRQVYAGNGIANLPAAPEPPSHPVAPPMYPDPIDTRFPVPPPPPHPYDPRDDGPAQLLPGNAGVLDEAALQSGSGSTDGAFLEMESTLKMTHEATVQHMHEIGLHAQAKQTEKMGMGNIFATNDLWRFRPTETQGESWAQILPAKGPIPAPRWLHASSIIGNSLFVFGGFTSNLMMDFWHLELDTNKWHELSRTDQGCPKCPGPRDGHSMVPILPKSGPKSIVMFGGIGINFEIKNNRKNTVLLDDVWAWSPEPSPGPWQEKNPACYKDKSCETYYHNKNAKPCARMMHSATSIGEIMVIFGGVGGGNLPLNDVWTWKAGKWTGIDYEDKEQVRGDGPPRARSLATLVPMDSHGRAMLFGGLNWQNKPLDDVWQVQLDIGAESPDEDGFEIENGKWLEIYAKNGGPLARFGHVAQMISPCNEVDQPEDPAIVTQHEKKSHCVLVFGGAGQTDLETDESERMQDARFEAEVYRQMVHTGDDAREKDADKAAQTLFDKSVTESAGPGEEPPAPVIPDVSGSGSPARRLL